MTSRILALTLAASVAFPLFAAAGPFRDFESDLRGAYGQYRTALFQTNSGNAEATMAAMAQMATDWAALRSEWDAVPPPQYQDDPEYSDTMASVAAILSDADSKVVAGDLAGAHLTLEAIREELAALHTRNGLISFSDRMNAYHAEMEAVLETDYAAMGPKALGALSEAAAVLRYLAADVTNHPAPEADNPAYAPLVAGLNGSVAALSDAVHAGDLDAALSAVGALKVPYAKLFAKFG